MKGFFRTMFLAGLVVLAVLCCGCGRESAGAWEAVDVAMGTMVRLKVYGPEEERAGEIFSQAREILQSLEEDELSWRLETSEVYRINASAGDGKGEALSAEMAQVLQTCLELYEKSEGAFDVTLGALVRLWKIDSWAGGAETGEFQAPSAGSLEEALGRCGSSMVGLLPKDSWQEGTRLLLPEGMQLDLGAVGKGLALSRILELLEEEPEVSGAVVYLGGSVLTYGSRPDGGSWKIGILRIQVPAWAFSPWRGSGVCPHQGTMSAMWNGTGCGGTIFWIRLRDFPQTVGSAVPPFCHGTVCLGMASPQPALSWGRRRDWNWQGSMERKCCLSWMTGNL